MDFYKIFNYKLDDKNLNLIIEKSKQNYKNILKLNIEDENNRKEILKFINEDTYIFNNLVNSGKCFYCLGINQNYWLNTIQKIINYNEFIILNFNEFQDKMIEMLKYYKDDTEEYIFIKKIIKYYIYKNNPTINKIYLDIKNNINLINQYYNKQYEVKINNKQYTINHNNFIDIIKNEKNINIKNSLTDFYYSKYNDIINPLINLFIDKYFLNQKLNIINVKDLQDKLLILQQITDNITNRCCLEINSIIDIKKIIEKDDNTKINADYIEYYIKILKELYGVYDKDITKNFNCEYIINILLILIKNYFNLEIKKNNINNEFQKKYNFLTYNIFYNNNLIGELVIDLYKRDNKLNNVECFNLNSSCYINNNYPVIINVISCNYDKNNKIINFDELENLIKVFGKCFYYFFNKQKYCYYNDKYIIMFEELFKLLFLTENTIKLFSNNNISKENIRKLINSLNLNYGLVYKYKCIKCLTDIFTTTNLDFIKELIELKEKNPELLQEHMKNIYCKFFNTIINNSIQVIELNKEHFQLINWKELFTDEMIPTFKFIEQNIYAAELFNEFNKYINNIDDLKIFIHNLIIELSNLNINFEKLLNHKPNYLSIIKIVDDTNITNSLFDIETKDKKIIKSNDQSVYNPLLSITSTIKEDNNINEIFNPNNKELKINNLNIQESDDFIQKAKEKKINKSKKDKNMELTILTETNIMDYVQNVIIK